MKGKRHPDANVDLGLAILSVINQPCIPLTQVEVAAFCGCSRQCIEQIERKALRKIRNRLRFGQDSQLYTELMDELFERRSVAVPRVKLNGN